MFFENEIYFCAAINANTNVAKPVNICKYSLKPLRNALGTITVSPLSTEAFGPLPIEPSLKWITRIHLIFPISSVPPANPT